jgi:EamA domain-containing membrane protein RarD
MASPALIWGLGLGIADGTFFALSREAYSAWSKLQRPNAGKESNTRLWASLVGAGAIGGIAVPLMYLWAAYSIGSLIEVHIYRCIMSVLFSLLFGSFIFKDTVNGFRALGVLFSMLGLVLVLSSSAWGQNVKVELNA